MGTVSSHRYPGAHELGNGSDLENPSGSHLRGEHKRLSSSSLTGPSLSSSSSAASASASAALRDAEFSAAQVRSLMARGLRPDMALLPFQMHRLKDDTFAMPEAKARRTVTLKNLLNVRRKSVRLVATPLSSTMIVTSMSSSDLPPSARVTFQYDALASGRICIWFMATEIVGPRDFTQRFEQNVVKRVSRSYDITAGLDQTFEQHIDDALLFQGVSDAHLVASAPSRFYPLVIEMTVIDDNKEQKTASVISPRAMSSDGTSIPVRSQYTYASLIRSSSGTLEARVVKQKIKVQGSCYEVQEIFGLEATNAAAPSSSATNTADDNDTATSNDTAATAASSSSGGNDEPQSTQECVVCMTNPRDTTVLPCRHMCLCLECANILRVQTNRCPICRTAVESLLNLPIARMRQAAAAEIASHASNISNGVVLQLPSSALVSKTSGDTTTRVPSPTFAAAPISAIHD